MQWLRLEPCREECQGSSTEVDLGFRAAEGLLGLPELGCSSEGAGLSVSCQCPGRSSSLGHCRHILDFLDHSGVQAAPYTSCLFSSTPGRPRMEPGLLSAGGELDSSGGWVRVGGPRGLQNL